MQLTDLTLEIRQGNLTRVGQIPWEEMDFELTNYHNNVGQWTLSLPSDHRLASVLRTPGAGMVLTGPGGTVLASGPTVEPEDAASPTDIDGTLTVTGITDDCVLGDYFAMPNPADPTVAGQAVQSHDVRTGPAETLMHQYVNANCGPGAHVTRRKPGLTMGTNLARGPVVKKSARFPKLGNLLSELGNLASLGFRVIQRGSVLVFETYAVADRSATIRLDVRNGTLSGHKAATAAPGVTHVFVAGQGEGEDRQFLSASTPESEAAAVAWSRRIERFVDQRQTDDPDEFQQKADEILGEEGYTGSRIQVVPLDDETGGMRFGVDWNLGDQVTVVVDDVEFTSIVTGFKLKADESGFRLGALIGQAQEDAARSFESRLSALERNAESLTRDDVQNAIDTTVTPLAATVSGIATDVASHETRLDAMRWQTFTPTWSGGGTPPSLGNGTITGRYLLVDKVAHLSIVLTMGSTTTYGGTSWTFTGLPFAKAALGARLYIPAMGFDSSAARVWPLFAFWVNDGALTLMSMPATANGSLVNVTATKPYTWATGDTIVVNGSFEIA